MDSNRRRVMVKEEEGIPYNAVDLGLPSGLLWAKGNITSNGSGGYRIGQETDYGAYFSWGNSIPHFCTDGSTFDDGYDFGTSSTGSPYKDTPGATIQYTTSSMDAAFSPSSIYDAARQLLGGKWRVPTGNEIQEMLDGTDYEYTTINGVRGGKYMMKSDHSVYIFLPFTGFYDTASHGIQYRTGLGDYWSSSLNSDDAAFYLYFQTNKARQLSGTGQRFMARGIRPVRESNSKNIPYGVWAYYSDGTLRAYSDADSSAIGVAVITTSCHFIIDKTVTNSGSSIRYGGQNKDLSGIGIVITDDSDTAKLDFAGNGNTTKIISALSGYNDGYVTGSPAATACRSAFNGKGYMGSLGEWYEAYKQKSLIDSMMSKIGGTALGSNQYWTSTFYNATNTVWRFTWDSGTIDASYRTSTKYVRAFMTYDL